MALIVEDGSGRADAESYGSVAAASVYFTNLGNTAWGLLTTQQQEALLRKGTMYIDAQYGERMRGRKKSSTQALEWPRVEAYDNSDYVIPSDTLPTRLLQATFEAALLSNTQDLLPTLSTPGSIKSTVQKVAVITEEITYTGGASQIPYVHKVHLLMSPLIYSTRRLQRS